MFDSHLPDLSYSAGVLGGGSDVLGFDTEMSSDHDWGPRVLLFLQQEDFETRCDRIRALAMEQLSLKYRVRIYAYDDRDRGARMIQRPNDPELEPRIEMYTIHGFCQKELGVDTDRPLSAADWLTITHHRLRSVVDARVFHDEVGLRAMRKRFAWYPHDIWLHVLASCWARMGRDETFAGRAGSVGDEIGSAVIAWRIIRDMIRLAFLMERSYPTYPNWLGSAFDKLKCAPVLHPLLTRIGAAANWKERDAALADAYRKLTEMHNALKLTPALPCEPMQWWKRPFTVSQATAIVGALRKEIREPSVRAIAERWMIGNIDLFNDNHLLDDDLTLRPLLMKLYE